MSSKFESPIREIPYLQQSVYNMLSDLTDIEKVRDKVPEDEIKDLTPDADSISIHSPMDDVQLNIVEKDEPKCIRFGTKKSPALASLWIQILSVTGHSNKMKLTMKIEVNPFIKAMTKEPLQEGIGKVVNAL